jgi:hypothetical protein
MKEWAHVTKASFVDSASLWWIQALGLKLKRAAPESFDFLRTRTETSMYVGSMYKLQNATELITHLPHSKSRRCTLNGHIRVKELWTK